MEQICDRATNDSENRTVRVSVDDMLGAFDYDEAHIIDLAEPLSLPFDVQDEVDASDVNASVQSVRRKRIALMLRLIRRLLVLPRWSRSTRTSIWKPLS